ncbi:uncharacterized protein [Venturia canescens]|uniref:uncharacterized protein n=1 Tax=Venturia canescens TaxID=32260 RepID=UPI001C9BD1F5|nr:uncharacterized protein LOC122407530 [Venturia canescens]
MSMNALPSGVPCRGGVNFAHREGERNVRSSHLPYNVYKERGSSILTPERPEMLKNILFVVSALAIARAQIPSLGWCPEYVPMANFDMGKFLGVWYEAERYFQILDPVSRCVKANYTLGPDGKYRVSNEVTNRFTGVKRVLEGEIRTPSTKAEEGKLHVEYKALPLTPETQYAILETDYKNFAVMWSCSGLGPLSAQNAWVMTRARRPEGPVLQSAYGVLDKYKISRTFFIKTNQEDCSSFDEGPPAPKPSESLTTEAPVVEEAGKKIVNLRSALVPEEEAADEKPEALADTVPEPEKVADSNAENVKVPEVRKEVNNVEPAVETAPSSVPEVILKVADRAKDIAKKTIDDVKITFEPIKETLQKPAEKFGEALEKPIENLQQTFEKPIGNLQQTFQKPYETIKETLQKPYESIKETLQKPYEAIKETLQKPIDRIKEAATATAPSNKDKEPEPSKEPLAEERK